MLISLACFRATFSIFAQSATIFPSSLQNIWRRAAEIVTAGVGQHLAPSNPLGNAIVVYLHAVGSEGGYGFFAPEVPDSLTLVFEIHFPDGRVEYDLPSVRSVAAGLRFNGVLEQINATKYEPLRQMILKILTYSVLQRYPNASHIRAIFTVAILPSTREFAAGREISYETLSAYDLTFAEQSTEPRD
ncbi:MAG TPA: hypothetical protein VGQ95_12525 [Chthoniobacterales bacterium]|nr:hypothetical protein [Chthoniobacterales bacterium]